ncbi:hypothetical protein ACS0TY_013787 [Phlomoides rotata]
MLTISLFSLKATPGNIQRLEHVLSAYVRLSGQLYNPAKFKVYFGSTVTSHVRNAMRRATGITEGSLPFTYLGVPIFRGAPRTSYLAALADSIIASLVHSMMVYYWPRSLLKRIETAMRNFLWSGDISKKNNSCSISWAHCCSPLEEGGLGIRSLRIANDSFMCKLAWDILCNKLANFTLIHDRYLTSRGKPRSYNRVSSIWPGNDNWLGYIISEKIGIPADFVAMLTSTIGDYFHDEQWYFDYDFFMMHTDGVKDILRVHVSRDTDDRVWGSSVSGQLTSRMAYDFIFPFREWAGPLGFGLFYPTVTALFDITLYYDIGFLDVFLQANTHHFSKQIGCLWRLAFITTCWSVWHACNRAIFDEAQPSVHRSFAYILASIKEAVPLARGHMTSLVRVYPLEAELASILHAIFFAFDRGWHSVWVESDSVLAIQTLQKHIQIVPWRLQGLWNKTHAALPHMCITFSHILWEGNQAADTLAKLHTNAT